MDTSYFTEKNQEIACLRLGFSHWCRSDDFLSNQIVITLNCNYIIIVIVSILQNRSCWLLLQALAIEVSKLTKWLTTPCPNQHFFLRCHFYHIERFSSLYDINELAINELNEDSIIKLVLFGSDKYLKETNRKILRNCITYFKATKRFYEPVLWPQTTGFLFLCCVCIYIYVYIYIYIWVYLYVYIYIFMYFYTYHIDSFLCFIYVFFSSFLTMLNIY